MRDRHFAPPATKKRNQPASTLILLIFLLLTFVGSGCGPGDAAGEAGELSNAQAQPPAEVMPFTENSTVFEILPAESEARFLIDEIFNGEEKTVVGSTNQVSGQMALDFTDPSTAAAGPIQVNANSLVTDNAFRDRAIRSRILLAGIYEFITFTPTAVNGMPEEIRLGDPVMFTIDGELTITTITRPVTLDVTAVAESETRLAGTGATTIERSDFDLVVPSATGVAAVGETVQLELNFVAEAAE